MNLTETLQENERYSYVFEGDSQSLDHALVTGNLVGSLAFDVVHLNAEFANQNSDHDPLVVQLDLGRHDLDGGNGVDLLAGVAGRDTLAGGNGSDRLDGFGGADLLRGGNGQDSLSGRFGADRLEGGNGDDLLTGGLGTDSLLGGNGADAFAFESLAETGDTILDFRGDDRLVLDGYAFGSVTAVQGATFGAGPVVIVSGDGALRYDADGTGAGEAVLLAQLQAGIRFTQDNLLLA